MEVIYHLILLIPVFVETIDDKRGDDHSDLHDFIVRAALTIFVTVVVTLIKCHDINGDFHSEMIVVTFIKVLLTCLAYFSALFQYSVNIAQKHITKAKWYDHLNNKSIPDKWKWYRSMDWRLRMCLHGLILIAGLVIYFV